MARQGRAVRRQGRPQVQLRRDFAGLAAPVLLVAAIAAAALGGGAERLQSLAQITAGPADSDAPSLSARADSESAAMASWLAGNPLEGERAAIEASRTASLSGGRVDPSGPGGDGSASVTTAAAGSAGTPGVASATGGGGPVAAAGGSSDGGSGAVQRAVDQTRIGVDRTVDRARDAVGRTRDAVDGAGRTVRDRTERVRDGVGSAVDEVTERVRRGANSGPGVDVPGLP